MEDLTRKSELLEAELSKTSKQLKEATAIAGEEAAKCKAAKEVIKSLTAQVSYILKFGIFLTLQKLVIVSFVNWTYISLHLSAERYGR